MHFKKISDKILVAKVFDDTFLIRKVSADKKISSQYGFSKDHRFIDFWGKLQTTWVSLIFWYKMYGIFVDKFRKTFTLFSISSSNLCYDKTRVIGLYIIEKSDHMLISDHTFINFG